MIDIPISSSFLIDKFGFGNCRSERNSLLKDQMKRSITYPVHYLLFFYYHHHHPYYLKSIIFCI